MGDMPFFCSEDYSYSSQSIRTACDSLVTRINDHETELKLVTPKNPY
jgi:hypothetical protein